MINLEWSVLDLSENEVSGLYNFASCKVDDDIFIFGGSKVPFSQSKKLYRISYQEVKKADISTRSLLKPHESTRNNGPEVEIIDFKLKESSQRNDSVLSEGKVSYFDNHMKPQQTSQLSNRSKRVSISKLVGKK